MQVSLFDRCARAALAGLLGVTARNGALRRALKRIVAEMPIASRLAARLIARGQADLVAAASRPVGADANGAAARFVEPERVGRAARNLIARHCLPQADGAGGGVFR